MRRWLILGLGVATVMLAVGCGSGSSSPPQSELQSSTETEATSTSPSAEESQAESGGPLTSVGTITGSPEKGTTFSDDYRVGPLLYSKEGSPPEEVLDACNVNNSTAIASSVFARGQVTITYQEGTLPTEVGVGSLERVVQEVDRGEEPGEGQLPSLVAFHAGGEWWCSSTSFVLHFQPRESQTFPIWVIAAQVLSNAQPRVPASRLNAWYFNPIGPPLEVDGGSVITRGPGAGWCEEETVGGKVERLFLYNRSGSC